MSEEQVQYGEPTLATLATLLSKTKEREDAVKRERIAIEEQIAELVETKANGSKTVDAGNGVKVTVKRAVTYKANIEAIRELKIPDELIPLKLVPETYKLDEKKYEQLLAINPTVGARISKFVEVKPRKVAVALKK